MGPESQCSVTFCDYLFALRGFWGPVGRRNSVWSGSMSDTTGRDTTDELTPVVVDPGNWCLSAEIHGPHRFSVLRCAGVLPDRIELAQSLLAGMPPAPGLTGGWDDLGEEFRVVLLEMADAMRAWLAQETDGE